MIETNSESLTNYLKGNGVNVTTQVAKVATPEVKGILSETKTNVSDIVQIFSSLEKLVNSPVISKLFEKGVSRKMEQNQLMSNEPYIRESNTIPPEKPVNRPAPAPEVKPVPTINKNELATKLFTSGMETLNLLLESKPELTLKELNEDISKPEMKELLIAEIEKII